MRIVILGLSITSSWGNGHATTFRGLVRELTAAGNDVLFLERDQPWYAGNRDLPNPPYGETQLYKSVAELKRRFAADVHDADCVIVGSYVPDGIVVGEWVTEHARGVTAFYDIDTPVTLSALESGACEYLSSDLVARFSLYLSFTGGPTLRRIENDYGSPMARALYCSVDPEMYFPERAPQKWMLGYLGTYSDDRQPTVTRLLIDPATRLPDARYVVAGPMYPDSIAWPANVERITHIEPKHHREFYNAQRFTLNVTRADMIRAGYSPSVRLFEAAACGTPIISDEWAGLDEFFEPGREILIATSTEDMVEILQGMPESDAREIGRRARERVLAEHTAGHRASELVAYIDECRDRVAENSSAYVTKE
ncbi:MAG: Spore_germination_protein_CgeB [uncultured Chthoniobacterales bacterium]|uniref:Spore_germination_protein_CgeB n=1 Tax=uncultured Chthoniobacterales bacterium TaxID=1836801 RepID=A0A6J4HFA6_9BACT|nr:MAG: Spore_germination_protein_CgeB [uncultured Chthoniobacterales bacterium]